MNRTHVLPLLVVTVAVLSLAVGSGSFTAAQGDRGVSLNVVSDDEGLVGYDSADHEGIESNETIDLVSISNRFNDNVTVEDVTVRTVAGEAVIAPDETDETLSPGESTVLTGSVIACGDGASTIQATVEVEGGGVWAAIYGDSETREFEVSCPSVDGVWFNGAGTIHVGASGLDEVAIHYWTTDENPTLGNGNGSGAPGNGAPNEPSTAPEDSGPISVEKTDHTETVATNTNLNVVPGQETVVAVEIPEYGVIYAHPGYDLTTGAIDDWGGGAGQEVDQFPTVQ